MILFASNRFGRWGASIVAGLLSVLFVLTTLDAAGASEPIELWPAAAPGEKGTLGPEADTTKPTDGLVADRRLIRLGNVSKPTLTLYRPPADRDTGAAVLVCPGGAYHILAMDLEGTEVCEWLNSIGVTGALLKYRVPRRPDQEKHLAPLQDAQRAMGLLRHRAPEWGLDPKRIGVLGFSAGGHLAAVTSTTRSRVYARVDEADDAVAPPNFAVLVYPGYLAAEGQPDRLAPEFTIASNTPPAFLVMTQDDPVRVENVFRYSLALKEAGVPFELHVYPTGGHGYGLRRTANPVTAWPDRAADWMRSNGWLGKK